MRHSDQVFRVRTSSTCECDGQFTQAKNFSPRGSEVAHRPLRALAPSSLSLSSAGPKRSWTTACSRSETRFHGQVAGFIDPANSPESSTRTRRHQPVGGSGAATRLELASRPWLNANTSAKFVVKINMCRIVCRLKKCRKFIIGWYPTNARANQPPN